MIVEVASGAIRAGTSVLYATTGELIAQRSGIINLGTEGSMLAGAFAAFAVTADTGSPFLGIMAGGIAGCLMALVHAFLVIFRKANQLASGLAVIFLAQGVTAFFGQSYVNKQANSLPVVEIPFLSDIPWVGPIFFKHDLLTYLSYFLVFAVWVLLFHSRFGLLLRSAGEREDVVHASGYRPQLIRFLAVLAGGFLAGVGGAQLSVAFTHIWVENMTQGRGFIAVALVIFASWFPGRAMLGAYLFGGAQALQLSLQARGVDISPYLLFMLPYVLTLVVLFLVERKRWNWTPQALQQVFEGGRGR
jgi:ABC-type uncharacterized transport system permease subunit